MSAAPEPQLTPMMAQYRRIKGELPKDALLLFRLGDFYEMFFEDAVEGARLLNVALTKRGAVPMCGIPFHAFNSYVARLLRAGRKVAVCDQMEEARPGQLVKREVTQILSPGTHFDERLLQAERNNFLAAVYARGTSLGLACVDLTTGDFRTILQWTARRFGDRQARLYAETLQDALKALVEGPGRDPRGRGIRPGAQPRAGRRLRDDGRAQSRAFRGKGGLARTGLRRLGGERTSAL